MSIFAISDLHLAKSIDKPMDIFGESWADYMLRIEQQWLLTVTSQDTVLIPGDISWATYLDESQADFSFIEALPGRKIISKGNHDYWWSSVNKLNMFKQQHSLKTVEFLHNNCFVEDKSIICGTRGWKCPGEDGFSLTDHKIYNRELQRLELSLRCAKSILQDNTQNGIIEQPPKQIIVAIHFPPFTFQKKNSELVCLMRDYGVSMCIYGHLHAHSIAGAIQGNIEGIEFKLVSSDYLGFKPLKLVD